MVWANSVMGVPGVRPGRGPLTTPGSPYSSIHSFSSMRSSFICFQNCERSEKRRQEEKDKAPAAPASGDDR